MALKLLKPPEAKRAADERLHEDLRRADSVHEVTAKLLKELAAVERQFEETLATQRMRWEQEDNERISRANVLKREVEELEDRRERALIPIVKREEELHNAREALTVREASLDDREASVEESGRVLMSRLDEIAERENKVQVREELLTRKEKGIEAQSKSTAQAAQAVTKKMTDFETWRQEQLYDISKKEAVASGQMLVIAEKEKQLSAREQDIQNREKRLLDRYALLERTEKRNG